MQNIHSDQAGSPANHYDVIIIGAGAAGLICAIEAGKRGRKVLMLEHTDQVGKKIRISGGGRCNFTNIHATPDDYQSRNKLFCVSALTRYTPQHFIALVDKHKIAWHEKKLGQLFCDGPAQQIVNMLVSECEAVGVTIRLNYDISSVKEDANFLVESNQQPVTSDSLVIATGGLSIPKMGATGFAYEIASQFGISVTQTNPGLVPFVFNGQEIEFYKRLAGVSIPCTATCSGVTFAENMLFTHKGVSGPAILQISSHWKNNNKVHLDLLPDFNLLSHLKDQQTARPKVELATVLSALLPANFVKAMCEKTFTNQPMNRFSLKDLTGITNTLKDWTIQPDGTEGYRTAEVTTGGVDTKDISSKTMCALKVQGLFFIGEAVDVTGPLGGYNFQWAWASGYCAGQYA
ncbi:MAG: NAD(P)/FAD-dependent oxidoreductase [Dehalococcoidia bacterium]|nr:NAD(P)/FAD-dependent oxidoreductase [Dehalococcoidia bacterium]